jgi:hypothetical protein
MLVILSLTRLMPHPVNFSPMAAIALFAGAFIPVSSMRYLVVFVIAIMSDLLVNSILYGYNDLSYPFQSGPIVIYGTYLLITWIGSTTRSISLKSIGIRSISASAIFFLTSNFMVWLEGSMYPQTISGLGACYLAAVPFIQNSVAGDLFFSATIFGIHHFAQQKYPLLLPQKSSK